MTSRSAQLTCSGGESLYLAEEPHSLVAVATLATAMARDNVGP